MPIRMTGLISGMDTETLIQNLVDAQKMKNQKTTNKKTLLEWKQEKWQDLNKKLYALYTEDLSKVRLQGSYLTKKVTSSDDTKVEVTAGTTTPEGSHVVSCSQLASAQYVTGNKVTTDGFGTASKLTDLGFTADASVININGGDKSVQLQVSSTTTVKDFLSACQSAGLNASYDSTQKRMFISSKTSGEDSAFSITTASLTSDGLTARDNIEGLVDMSISANVTTVNNALQAFRDGGDTTATEQTLVDLAVSNVDAQASKKAQDFYGAVAYKAITDDAAKMADIEAQYAGIADATERQTAIDKAVQTAADELYATEEYQTYVTDATQNGIDDATVTAALGLSDPTEIAAYTFEDKATRTSQATTSMETAIADYKALVQGGAGESTSVNAADSALINLGLGEIGSYTADADSTETVGGFTVIAAKNSVIKYNGVEMESSNNSVSVNGLTINLKGVTSGDVTLNVASNTEENYKMIKDFITEYNSILEEMNDLYYAKSTRGYDPLSDDEKESMTDDQIDKWETTIKDSILRRDSQMGSLLDAMKGAMQTSVEVDGKRYSLASFGVGTSTDYTEKGLLHIRGDSDDELYSTSKNKLMAALESDPETVMKVFSGVAGKLYDTMQDKMKKTSLSSAMTFYNDKEITKQITSYTKKIAKEEDEVTELEDKYYAQFSAMETALADLQSQQNALAGLLGS
ncbi:flagellar filament capping protein FliD [Anaeromicropila populeti]|uniref:Flagellar hook-associated protein 2 n=1 Tax=Anaeromicropila populeti TaxID=37658 RepID=A0A1I6HWX2_9FIRM|nr:flagellar filament capping protein FliD [Anaeromicropila populeti]SFR58924.1 flagellar hook-associated protein 2 [Anaeromicropila populeti]